MCECVCVLTTELMFSLLRSMARTLLIKLPTRGSRGDEESRNDHRSCKRDSLELSFSTMVYTSAVSSSQAKCGYLEVYTYKDT